MLVLFILNTSGFHDILLATCPLLRNLAASVSACFADLGSFPNSDSIVKETSDFATTNYQFTHRSFLLRTTERCNAQTLPVLIWRVSTFRGSLSRDFSNQSNDVDDSFMSQLSPLQPTYSFVPRSGGEGRDYVVTEPSPPSAFRGNQVGKRSHWRSFGARC